MTLMHEQQYTLTNYSIVLGNCSVKERNYKKHLKNLL